MSNFCQGADETFLTQPIREKPDTRQSDAFAGEVSLPGRQPARGNSFSYWFKGSDPSGYVLLYMLVGWRAGVVDYAAP